jgi:hypothetical protein
MKMQVIYSQIAKFAEFSNRAGLVNRVARGKSNISRTLALCSISIALLTCGWGKPALSQPASVFVEQSADFAGPFASWLNVKTQYGAKGDGISDDTAALQAALADQPRMNRVIWLPRGTYNISSTLTMTQGFGVTIIGENPSTTTIEWTGPVDGTMLDFNGCTRIKVSRLTIDGNNTAGTGEKIWYSPSLSYGYPTYNEFSDQTIRNLKVGLEHGQASETVVERVHFDNDTAGISETNPNSLDLWVRDSLFTGNGVGVTNAVVQSDAGSFNVSNSVFVGSKIADMSIACTGILNIRRNLSIGSQAFFTSTMTGAQAQITFQANTIVSPGSIPLQIGPSSPIVMIDNNFYGIPSSAPVLWGFNCCVPLEVLSVGNRAASIKPFSGNIGQVRSIDDLYSLPMPVANFVAPTSVYVPPLSTAPVFEAPAGANSAAIQARINQAAKQTGGGIVHIPAGVIAVKTTLVIPQGGPVELVGDGPFATFLVAGPGFTGAVLQSQSLQARIAELQISQNTNGSSPTAEGIQVSVPDQPGTHIVFDEYKSQQDLGVFVDGIDQASVEFFAGVLNSQTESAPESKLVGGPTLKSGSYAFGRINMFQSGTDFFTIDNGAQLLEEDFWHDPGETGPAIDLTGGNGSLTVSGASLYTFAPVPTITVSGFTGNIGLVGINTIQPIELALGSEGTSIMLAGSQLTFTDSPVQTAGPVGTLGEVLNANNTGNGPAPTNDIGNPSDSWIEQMLNPVRANSPRPRLPLSGGNSRIRIERVLITSTSVGIHVMPNSSSSSSAAGVSYVLRDQNGIALDGTSSRGCVAESTASSPAWTIQGTADGGIYLESAVGFASTPIGKSGTGVVLADSATDAHQEWNVLPVGDGNFQVVNRATGQALTSNGSGACVGLATSSNNAAEEWSMIAAAK